MQPIPENQDNIANLREYHSPKVRKFGSVSDLTLTNPGVFGDPTDGGGGFNQYGS